MKQIHANSHTLTNTRALTCKAVGHIENLFMPRAEQHTYDPFLTSDFSNSVGERNKIMASSVSNIRPTAPHVNNQTIIIRIAPRLGNCTFTDTLYHCCLPNHSKAEP